VSRRLLAGLSAPLGFPRFRKPPCALRWSALPPIVPALELLTSAGLWFHRPSAENKTEGVTLRLYKAQHARILLAVCGSALCTARAEKIQGRVTKTIKRKEQLSHEQRWKKPGFLWLERRQLRRDHTKVYKTHRSADKQNVEPLSNTSPS